MTMDQASIGEKIMAAFRSLGTASGVALCQHNGDVAQALEIAVKAGRRPTIQLGGHCYEGFVYDNPGGTIIDVRNMNGITQDPTIQTTSFITPCRFEHR